MKIPASIKIGGHKFTVELVDYIDDDDSAGECDVYINTIRIKKSLNQSQKEETLIHEVIHAMDMHMTEAQVDRLGFNLYQVLKDANLLK